MLNMMGLGCQVAPKSMYVRRSFAIKAAVDESSPDTSSKVSQSLVIGYHACVRAYTAYQINTCNPNNQAEESLQQFKLIGPSPQRFTPAKGQLLDVAQAAFPSLTRLGSGGFVYGYTTALKPDDSRYALVKGVMGRKLEEASNVITTFPRPQKSLVLYEFEGCPYCRKVCGSLVNQLDAP